MEAPEQLKLPAFPELPLQHGAPVLPLMRVLPDWRRLWRLLEGRRHSQERLARLQLVQERPPRPWPWVVTAPTAGSGAAGLILVLGVATLGICAQGACTRNVIGLGSLFARGDGA